MQQKIGVNTCWKLCRYVLVRIVQNREYWMVYRGPGFLAVVWFGLSHAPPTPPPHPSLPSVCSNGDTQEDWDRQLVDGRGGRGKEPNHTTVRKMVLNKSFNTLWCRIYSRAATAQNKSMYCRTLRSCGWWVGGVLIPTTGDKA